MIRTSWCLMLLAAAAAQSQVKTADELGHGNGVLDSGVILEYKTMIEPHLTRGAFQPLGSGFGVAGNTMRHFVYDKAAASYFGYDMVVFPGEAENSRQVVLGPLTESTVRQALEAVAGNLPLHPAPLPKYPPPQVVHDGDTIALDLMVSPDGRERMVDYIQFTFGPKSSKPPAVASAPRDFTIDDGPVKFSMTPPDVFLDGAKFRDVFMDGSRGGATLWFYFPGQGRYILSLAPHDGFMKAGTVRGSSISFHGDGEDYEIRMAEPLAGVEKAWNLYVLHDPMYLPRSALVNRVVGSMDRLENLLPKM